MLPPPPYAGRTPAPVPPVSAAGAPDWAGGRALVEAVSEARSGGLGGRTGGLDARVDGLGVPLLTVAEVAAYLRRRDPHSSVAARFVRRLHGQGLPFVQVGRQRLTPAPALQAWLFGRGQGGVVCAP